MKKLLSLVVITFLAIAGLVFPSPANYIKKASSSDAFGWRTIGHLQTNAKVLRTERTIGDFNIYLGPENNTIGIMKIDAEHNFKGARVLQEETTGVYPYDLRFYGDFVIVGNRKDTAMSIYKFHSDGNPKYLEKYQTLNIHSVGAVKLFIDSSKGMLYSPNQDSNNFSVIDLNPLNTGGKATLINNIPMPTNSKPARIVGVASGVIATFDAGLDRISTYDVRDPYDVKYIKSIQTGKNPYYGEGNGKVFLVDSQDSNYVTMIDMTNPFDMQLISHIVVGDSPLIPQFMGKNKDIVWWTVQGYNSGSDKNVQGYLVGVDISDVNNPKITAKLLTQRGCGGLEKVITAEQKARGEDASVLLTINTPHGTLSWVDVSNPYEPKLIENTYFYPNSEPHYTKFSSDGHHAMATDRVNNTMILMSDLEDGVSPEISFLSKSDHNQFNVMITRNDAGKGLYSVQSTTPDICRPSSDSNHKSGDVLNVDILKTGKCSLESYQVMNDKYASSVHPTNFNLDVEFNQTANENSEREPNTIADNGDEENIGETNGDDDSKKSTGEEENNEGNNNDSDEKDTQSTVSGNENNNSNSNSTSVSSNNSVNSVPKTDTTSKKQVVTTVTKPRQFLTPAKIGIKALKVKLSHIYSKKSKFRTHVRLHFNNPKLAKVVQIRYKESKAKKWKTVSLKKFFASSSNIVFDKLKLNKKYIFELRYSSKNTSVYKGYSNWSAPISIKA